MKVNPVLKQLNTQFIHGINPVFKHPKNGQITELPRFCSAEMKTAREMNKLAIYDTYKKVSNTIPPKASSKDTERLLSEKYEDSLNRAVWTNPTDRKSYYLLKEDETKNGIELRVLKENGEFFKNTIIKPEHIILGDLAEGDNYITNILGMDFNHSDFIETIAKRYNPFAKYEIIKFKDDYELLELAQQSYKNAPYIELSYVIESKIPEKMKGKDIETQIKDTLLNYAPDELEYLEKLKKLSSKSRVLMSSGNNGGNTINSLLISTGFEGVGGLNNLGKVESKSGSKSSYFTQHYETFNFPVTTTPFGLNITGLRGTDIPLEHALPPNNFLYNLRGTSFSAPVRVAKLALNDMLKGMTDV